MKWVLLLSLILNGVLAWRLSQKKEVVREEIVEKIIVKKSAPEVIEKKVIVEVPKKSPEETASVPRDFDEVAVTDTVEDVNKTREDFLVGKLGLTEREFKAIEEVKKNYMERYQKIVSPDQPMLTLEQRKALIQLEEERNAEFARAMGPDRWRQFENFRNDYNKKEYKRAMKHTGVIVPMEI
jgi:hypothetical protein